MNGWHFAASTLRDGRPLPAPGERLEHDGPVVPCESGLHFSVRAIDALVYAPGAMVARVVGPDDAVPHGSPVDKHCGAWRVAPHGYVDATRVLHLFACDEATRAMDAVEALGGTVGPRSRAAVEVTLAWLDGTATDAARAAAWAAAVDAAWAAARAAAGAAAVAAAWAAAVDAAWAAARAAAGAAAVDAAGDAARAAAGAAAVDAAGDAARAAARAVAGAAAGDASNARLEAALSVLFTEGGAQ